MSGSTLVQVTPVLGIPKGHIKRVEKIGYIIGIAMGALTLSAMPAVSLLPSLLPLV